MNKRLRINPISKKRAVALKAYGELCKQMDAIRPYCCWFCGKEIKDKPDHHHTKGRDGDYYLAKEYLVLAHRDCHNQYHFSSLENLLKTDWYIKWLNSLTDNEVKNKELNKFSKSNLKLEDYDIRGDI